MSTPAPGRAMLLAGLVVGLVVLVLAGVGLARTGWARCVICAMAGAAAFGLVSALVRAVSQAVTSGQIGILDPAVLTSIAGVVAAILAGGWLIQQAFASGPPEVVVACLTVVDPIVAVLFGVALLGEGNATSPAALGRPHRRGARRHRGRRSCWPATTPRPPPGPHRLARSPRR